MVVALVKSEHYLLQDNAVSMGTKDVEAAGHIPNDVWVEREGR